HARDARLRQLRRADDDGEALRARDRDVQAVRAEQELEAAWGALAGARTHRQDHDRGLLALQLVDRGDAQRRKAPSQEAYLQVVWRDDEDVGRGQRARGSVFEHELARE